MEPDELEVEVGIEDDPDSGAFRVAPSSPCWKTVQFQ